MSNCKCGSTSKCMTSRCLCKKENGDCNSDCECNEKICENREKSCGPTSQCKTKCCSCRLNSTPCSSRCGCRCNKAICDNQKKQTNSGCDFKSSNTQCSNQKTKLASGTSNYSEDLLAIPIPTSSINSTSSNSISSSRGYQGSANVASADDQVTKEKVSEFSTKINAEKLLRKANFVRNEEICENRETKSCGPTSQCKTENCYCRRHSMSCFSGCDCKCTHTQCTNKIKKTTKGASNHKGSDSDDELNKKMESITINKKIYRYKN